MLYGPTASESSDLYIGSFSNTSYTGKIRGQILVFCSSLTLSSLFMLFLDWHLYLCSKSLQFHTSWKGYWEAIVQERWSGPSQNTKSRNGYGELGRDSQIAIWGTQWTGKPITTAWGERALSWVCWVEGAWGHPGGNETEDVIPSVLTAMCDRCQPTAPHPKVCNVTAVTKEFIFISFSNPIFYLFWQKQTKNAKGEELKSKEEPSNNRPTLLSDMATQNSSLF